MRGRKPKLIVELDEPTKANLQTLLRAQKTPVGLARRARAMLLLAEGVAFLHTAQQVGLAERHVRKWAKRFVAHGIAGLADLPRPGRSLSQWDCAELALQLVTVALVATISAATIRRKLTKHKLKPWRHHLWLSPKVPRDEAFAKAVREISALYHRPLNATEVVLCLDEKTSLQPRTRLRATRPARAQQPNQVEAEYERKGSLNLLAAFDTSTGRVYARTAPRKRQSEFIALLEQLEAELDPAIKRIHLVLENVPMHKGKLVQAWLQQHQRFEGHLPPVHCRL